MNKYLTNKYKDIDGVTIIDSGLPGKNIAIFAITHGDENVGLKLFKYLENDFNIGNKLKCGKIFLIAVNIRGYLKNKRFIDHDMNRISNKEFISESYEFIRLKELKNIFPEIDIAIDLHSVSKGDETMGIVDKKYLNISRDFLNVDNILVDNISKTGALISELTRNNKEAYGLECGNHSGDNAIKNGLNNVLNILAFKGFIDHKIFKIDTNEIYEFLYEIYPKTEKFKFMDDYKGFNKIEFNSIYAIDNGIERVNSFGNNIYIGLVSKIPKKGISAGFLFKKLD